MSLPFSRTWWIEPGKIIGGRYPGTPDPEASRQMLVQLISSGVRVVINLQEEHERGAHGKPFRDYSTDLCAMAAETGVEVGFHRFPIGDCDVPTPEVMSRIQHFIRDAVEAGKLVYVHCWGGHGRTGTVAGCWLRENGVSGDEAMRTIELRRRHDEHLSQHPAPETEPQRKFIRTWERRAAVMSPEAKRTDQHAPDAKVALQDRAVGSLLGLAVGDAVGAAVEFKRPGSFKPLTDLVGGGPFDLKPGEWTDDTSMALCLAESLSERGYFDPVDQLKRYVRWWKEGHFSVKGHCFDIGNQVKAALGEFVSAGEPFCGPTGPYNAGNGSLMRLCPVAIAYAHSPAAAIVHAGESSRTTHGNAECVDACRYFAGLIIGAIRGEKKEKLLSPGYCPIPGLWDVEPLQPKVGAITSGSFKKKQPPQIKDTGYVIDCLEAALWAFHTSDSFAAGVLRAANLGDDADTTAAVCGQIAGAFYGASGIPQKWLAKLAQREVIESLATQLVSSSHALK